MKISSFLLVNSCLVSLKLIILIFSSRHSLHLLLKLFVIKDFLMILHFIWGVSPCSFKVQMYFKSAVWFLSGGSLKVFIWLYNLYFQFLVEIPMYTISTSFLCFLGTMLTWYSMFSELHLPSMGHLSFLLQFESNICTLLLSMCDFFLIVFYCGYL